MRTPSGYAPCRRALRSWSRLLDAVHRPVVPVGHALCAIPAETEVLETQCHRVGPLRIARGAADRPPPVREADRPGGKFRRNTDRRHARERKPPDAARGGLSRRGPEDGMQPPSGATDSTRCRAQRSNAGAMLRAWAACPNNRSLRSSPAVRRSESWVKRTWCSPIAAACTPKIVEKRWFSIHTRVTCRSCVDQLSSSPTTERPDGPSRPLDAMTNANSDEMRHTPTRRPLRRADHLVPHNPRTTHSIETAGATGFRAANLARWPGADRPAGRWWSHPSGCAPPRREVRRWHAADPR